MCEGVHGLLTVIFLISLVAYVKNKNHPFHAI